MCTAFVVQRTAGAVTAQWSSAILFATAKGAPSICTRSSPNRFPPPGFAQLQNTKSQGKQQDLELKQKEEKLSLCAMENSRLLELGQKQEQEMGKLNARFQEETQRLAAKVLLPAPPPPHPVCPPPATGATGASATRSTPPQRHRPAHAPVYLSGEPLFNNGAPKEANKGGRRGDRGSSRAVVQRPQGMWKRLGGGRLLAVGNAVGAGVGVWECLLG